MYHHSKLDLKDFSRLTFHTSRKSAFTLAEILITLGIIGVVAAITMPMLIQKHKNQVILTGLKKSYAELQNVANQISNDYGSDIATVLSGLTLAEQNELFMKYFDGASDCTDSTCFKNQNINYYTYAGSEVYQGLAYASNYYFMTNRFITKDGRLFVMGSNNFISVDVNGPFVGPNALGRDTFTFKSVDGAIRPCGGSVSCVNVHNYDCNASSTGSYAGIGCTYYALTKEGFLDKKYYYQTYTGEL